MDYKKIINPYVGMAGYNCFACSPDNPIGLHLSFYEDGDDIVCHWKPNDNYTSWINTLHGGIQALLLDEICGWVVARKVKTGGVTTNMDLRYRHPVTTDGQKIEVRARIRERKRNLIVIDATLADGDGQICTEATCTYFTFSVERSIREMAYRDCHVEGEEP
jgi:acyl-coenzyme A thioesterase PaaI-like protein